MNESKVNIINGYNSSDTHWGESTIDPIRCLMDEAKVRDKTALLSQSGGDNTRDELPRLASQPNRDKESKANIIVQLKKEIFSLQSFNRAFNNTIPFKGLESINPSFPQGIFPLAAIHEFISDSNETASATSGFLAGLLSSIMNRSGMVIWISTARTIFPPALKYFGVPADKIIFIHLKKEKEIQWVMEESLKCKGLSAVVSEMNGLSFTASKRLQLAIEESGVTGFVIRNHSQTLNPTACVTRWKITSLPGGSLPVGMPGVGFPRWDIELLKVKNGKPGKWEVEFLNGHFRLLQSNSKMAILSHSQQQRKAG